MRWSPHILLLAILAAGCNTPVQPSPTPSDGGQTPTSSSPFAPDPSFAAGIYYTLPGGPQGVGRLTWLDGRLPDIRTVGVGFDLRPERLATVSGSARVMLTSADARSETLQLTGLYHPARPSLSPDGQWALVQALDHAEMTGGPDDDFDIYLADLRNGTTTKISSEPVNEESPEWVPGTDLVLWSAFDPDTGIHAVLYNVTTRQQVRTMPDAGAIHLDASSDARLMLDPGRMRIHDLSSGQQVADLSSKVLDALREEGYEPDDRFPGQAGRGTIPMDGAFSPDGDRIVFDGAVRKDGRYGVILARIATDGTGFEVLTPLIDVDPSRSNGHNFSQLNPTWI